MLAIRGPGNGRAAASPEKPIPARCVVTPVKDSAGRVTSFVAVLADLTAAKRQEAERKAALTRAEAGDRRQWYRRARNSHSDPPL